MRKKEEHTPVKNSLEDGRQEQDNNLHDIDQAILIKMNKRKDENEALKKIIDNLTPLQDR